MPAFGIYGSEVQEQDYNSITPDAEEKLLRFGRAAVAVMEMRGKSYLSIGSVSVSYTHLIEQRDKPGSCTRIVLTPEIVESAPEEALRSAEEAVTEA